MTFLFPAHRRDLTRAVKLLEMVKRREKMKKDELQLNIDIYEKRYQAKDFAGQLLAEYTAVTTKSRYIIIINQISKQKLNNFLFLDPLLLQSTPINTIIIRQVTWHRIQINGTRHKTTRAAPISIIICRTREILMA